jgi:DNA-binding response OmpR family regulator
MQEAKMPAIPRPRVLCVDDDEDSRVMLTTLLGIALIEAKAVGTAAQALSLIRAQHFDLYLLDSRLSDADGFELCRRIRNYDPQTPIVFFSGAAYEADKKRGIEAGANGYVIKPDLEALLGSIKQFVSQAESDGPKILPFRPNINSFSPFTFDPAAA